MELKKPKLNGVQVQIKKLGEKSESFTVYETSVKEVVVKVQMALTA